MYSWENIMSDKYTAGDHDFNNELYATDGYDIRRVIMTSWTIMTSIGLHIPCSQGSFFMT